MKKEKNEFSLTKRQAAILLGVILLVMAGYLLYQHFNQSQPVTAESQTQAETPAGVELAAKNAHIDMLQSQLNEAAKQITELKNKPPDTIIKTVPYEVVKVVEKEVEKRGANFSIITDPNNPDKAVDLKDIEKMPENTSVMLNQYNVFAYKKVIKGVNMFPDWGEAFQGRVKINEITGDINRRITKDGKYLGIVVGYDFKHDYAKAGIRYSF